MHPNVSQQAEELKEDIINKLPGSKASVTFIGAEHLVKLTQERTNDVFRLKISETPLSAHSGERERSFWSIVNTFTPLSIASFNF